MRWWSALAVLVVLVVAVVVVRPGSRAPEESLAVPAPSGLPSAPPSVGPVRGPSDLPDDLTVADVVTSPSGVGPLVLGTSQEDLAAAGWTFRYGQDDCTRLVPVTVGEVAFSGWVVEGRLATAQLEMADLRGRTSPSGLGFTFGRPLAEAEGYDVQTLPAGEGGPGGVVPVGVGRRSTGGADLVVSDLGQYGVRYAEVRRAGSRDCVADVGALGEAETATVAAASAELVPSLSPGQVGPVLSFLGAGAEQLQAPASPWAEAAAAVRSVGCERVESVTPEGSTELFLQDGVVVGQRFLAAGEEWVPERASWTVDATGDLVQRTRSSFQRSDGESAEGLPPLSGSFVSTAELVPALDTAVPTGPRLTEASVGQVCSDG